MVAKRKEAEARFLMAGMLGTLSGKTVGDLYGGEMPDNFVGGKTRWNFMKNKPTFRLGGGEWSGGARAGGFSVNPYSQSQKGRPGGLTSTTASSVMDAANKPAPAQPPASVLAPTPLASPFLKKAV